MNYKQHTPGPWFSEPYGRREKERWSVFADSGLAVIASVCRGVEPDPVGEANANLIAAAPDLLAACDALLSMRQGGPGALAQLGIATSLAGAAAAKARGEKQRP